MCFILLNTFSYIRKESFRNAFHQLLFDYDLRFVGCNNFIQVIIRPAVRILKRSRSLYLTSVNKLLFR